MEEENKSNVCTHHGKNVAFWRNFKKWSQEVLSEKLGLSQVQVSRLEEKEVIEDDTLKKIAKALGITLAKLKECDHQHTIDYCMSTINYIFNVENGASVANLGDVKQTINNPLETVKELYERIIELTKENTEFKAEIERLKGK
ncbi:MAG: helix-turn-helix domain-containing protein [Prevotella sp.]|jgi:transcriptional regulator with XRE-family HTH domain|nr:helix-turn-helix domain-containing protein [Prevotella sp.]